MEREESEVSVAREWKGEEGRGRRCGRSGEEMEMEGDGKEKGRKEGKKEMEGGQRRTE